MHGAPGGPAVEHEDEALPPASAEPDERLLWSPRELPALGPDVAGDLVRYRRWLDQRRAARAADPDASGEGVAVSVGVVVESPVPEWFAAMLRSLQGQTHRRWRLHLCCRSELPANPEVRDVLHALSGNVHVHRCPADGSALETLGTALAGPDDAVVLLGQHDLLAADALARLTAAALEADAVYADEDRVDARDRHDRPSLKPDWSPELLLSAPYVGRPFLVRRATLDAAGGVRRLAGGSWEHDLMLRVGEAATTVGHVAEVLYHRRLEAGRTLARARAPAAVVEALDRRDQRAWVEPGPVAGSWRVHREPGRRAAVTVVIPFRDSPWHLRTCVDTLTATAGGADLQLVLVDNGSVEPETATLLERLDERADVTVRRDDRPFNWAALNNAAVETARGGLLLFLNDDIEARRPGWLQALAAQARRPEVAAVGARLLYPDGRLQHAGVVVGLGGAAGHVLAGLPSDAPGYLGMAVLTRECSAVTGACLMCRRDVFEELGGFDESLGMDLNDVDFCLRAGARGYRVLYEPQAELVHHESPSRGTSASLEDIRRFVDRWASTITAGDPSLNSNLTRVNSSCALQVSDEEGWWQRWRSTLGTC